MVFLAWSIPAFIFVFWTNSYYPDVEFYNNAIKEGIGPNLWNAIGGFGIFAFGIAVIFSPFSTPSVIAHKILSNAYAIGCLSFGLLVGQWFLLPFAQLEWWQKGLFGVTSVFLLPLSFVYNLVIWYLSFLIQNSRQNKSAFLINITKLHWLLRALLGAFVSGIALFAFMIPGFLG